jgi:predicted Rdx family selenoprotein
MAGKIIIETVKVAAKTVVKVATHPTTAKVVKTAATIISIWASGRGGGRPPRR